MEIDLERINDSDHLLDILIQMENVLDSLDIYVFRNWFDGEVVEGPIVRRYWTTFSLLYPYNRMPDPRAALRLLKHGVQVEFDRMKRRETVDPNDPSNPQQTESETPSDWLVTISFPRRLLDQNEEADLKVYADEVNPDDVTSAKDTGLDDESQYNSDEQLPDQGMGQMPPDQGMGQMPMPQSPEPPK